MKRSLSKSTQIMFFFDFLTILLITYFCSDIFFQNASLKIRLLAVFFEVIIGLFVFNAKEQYKIREFNNTVKNSYLLFEGCLITNIITGILISFFMPATVVFKFILFNSIITFILLKIYRIGFHYFLFNIKKIKRVIIVGANERAKITADVIKNRYALKMEVKGIIKSGDADFKIFEQNSKLPDYGISPEISNEYKKISENENNFVYDDVKIYPDGLNIQNICSETEADICIFTYPTELTALIPSNVIVYYMPDFYEMATGKYYIDETNLSVFALNFLEKRSEFNTCIYNCLKRIFDIVSALIILTLTLPVTLTCAVRVWMTDKESPIYTQDRAGRNGRTFKAYKIRTMYSNNFVPTDSKKVGYVENQNLDDRVIPFCRFIRKARFDEIPQMINIIKGEMSIVGPRAEWTKVAEVYKKEVKGYRMRMLVNTAWTGWAQINQGYCFASENENIKLQYDLYYIKHRNILWDIAILIKAVFLALGGRHA